MDEVALEEVLVAEAPFWEVEDVFGAGSDLETPPAVVEGTAVVVSAAAESWEDVVGCCETLMGAEDCW